MEVTAVDGTGIEIGMQQAGLVEVRVEADAETHRHFNRVDDVEVVRPGFGKVFPRMGRRVGGDETCLPAHRRSLAVVPP